MGEITYNIKNFLKFDMKRFDGNIDKDGNKQRGGSYLFWWYYIRGFIP